MSKANLNLFDTFERDYLGPSKFSESHWGYINRTARSGYDYIRDLFQTWFDDYEAPAEKRNNLWREFRSEQDNKFLSTFFELYLYQMFKKLGFKIEVEPDWHQGKPDFLLTAPNGQVILLEATSIYPKSWYGKEKTAIRSFIDCINKNVQSSSYSFIVRIYKSSDNIPNCAEIVNFVRSQLENLNYDEVVNYVSEHKNKSTQLNYFPYFDWKQPPWSVRFCVKPKSSEQRSKSDERIVNGFSDGITKVDPVQRIDRCLGNKSSRYGELDLPYILAINNLDISANDSALVDALFGTPRKPDGAWFGPRGYQKRRMSGIVAFKRLRPESMHRVDPVFWHHPAANHPVAPKLLPIAQWIPNTTKDVYELLEGHSQREILGLDETKMPY